MKPKRFGMKGNLLTLLIFIVSFSVTLGIVYPMDAFAAQDIRKIETRPGVTIKILLHTPEVVSSGTLLIFPGSLGEGHFSGTDGDIRLGGNFLVRTSPQFVQKGYAVAIIDVPSDHEDGMSDSFRKSPEHAQDIKKVIEFLQGKNPDPIYLVGTSRGTISAAYLAAVIKDDVIKGVVLTSTLAGKNHVGSLPLEQITLPVMLVHHRSDGCSVSLFGEALDLKGRFKGSPKVDFVSARGGVSPEDTIILSGKRAKEQVNPCKAMTHHGYIGVEEKVVGAITDWASGKPVPPEVGD